MQSRLEKSLQQDIDLIRENVIEMGGLVESALKASMGAIENNDRQLAYAAILKDRYIDELEDRLATLCQKFFIRHVPVAGHMRFVYSIIKINTELERTGDYAKAIARRFLTVNSLNTEISYPKIIEMGNLAIPLLHNALRAFSDQDAELARMTLAREKEKDIDNLRYEAHRDLIQMHSDGELSTEALVPLVTIVGRLERVANQGGNICEEVLYIYTGQDQQRCVLQRPLRVLFVDIGDACRAQFAEGIANSLGLEQVRFNSMGVTPRSVGSKIVQFMAEKGIDVSNQRSKHLNEVLDLKSYEVIITLCEEAEKTFPPSPSKTVRISWKIADASELEGSLEELRPAYEKIFRHLDTHIRDLLDAVLHKKIQEEGSDKC